MSRYFNDFDAMDGESLEHGFGEKAYKYIDKVKTKSGKWRYIYKKKMAEALDKQYEKNLPKGYKKTVDGDTTHYEYKDKDGYTVSEDVKGRGLIRDHDKISYKMLDVKVGPPETPNKKKKTAPKKVNVKKKKLTPKTGREMAEEAMLAGGSYSLNAKARKQQAKKKKKKKLFNLDDIREGIY